MTEYQHIMQSELMQHGMSLASFIAHIILVMVLFVIMLIPGMQFYKNQNKK